MVKVSNVIYYEGVFLMTELLSSEFDNRCTSSKYACSVSFHILRVEEDFQSPPRSKTRCHICQPKYIKNVRSGH